MFFTIQNRGRGLGEKEVSFRRRAVGLMKVTFLSLMFLWVLGRFSGFLLARGKERAPHKKLSLKFMLFRKEGQHLQVYVHLWTLLTWRKVGQGKRQGLTQR